MFRRTAHIKLRNALGPVTMSRVSRNRKHFLHRVDRLKIVCVNSINSLSSDACPSFSSVDVATPLAHLSGHDTFAYIIGPQRNVIHPGNQRDELGISPLTTYINISASLLLKLIEHSSEMSEHRASGIDRATTVYGA